VSLFFFFLFLFCGVNNLEILFEFAHHTVIGKEVAVLNIYDFTYYKLLYIKFIN